MQVHPQQEQLLAEVVLAFATEVQQRAVTWLLAFEASDPRIKVPVGLGLVHDQARGPEKMVSVKAQRRCTCHLSPPNLAVLRELKQVAEPHQQVLQRDLQVHDEGSQSMQAQSSACKLARM